MNKRNLILLLLLGISLCFIGLMNIALVNASEWDNVKDYDTLNKEVTITNSLGLGSDIAKIKLLSEQNVYVFPGKNKQVAELELWFNSDFREQYDTQFKETALIETYDLAKEMNLLDRDIKLKYASKTETRYDTQYNKVCEDKGETSINGSSVLSCQWIQTRNKPYVVVLEWSDFTELSKLPNPARIGLFTDVKEGDVIEWIPEFFGVKIEEWATWTASFNVDLQFYYSFNRSDSPDENIINGSIGNMTYSTTKVNVKGKYENGTRIIPNNYMYANTGIGGSNSTINSTTGTINFWFNWSWQASNVYGFFMIDDTSLFIPSFIVYADTRANTGQPDNLRYDLIFNMDTAGQDFALLTYNNSLWAINDSGYHMITLNHNGSELEWYLDGTKQTGNYFGVATGKPAWFRRLVNEGAYTMSFDTRGLGGYARGNMGIDEFGLWSRSLSASEVSDLYNSGAGIFYTPEPVIPTEIDVLLDRPLNNTQTTNTNQIFNASLTPLNVNLTNATLLAEIVEISPK